MMDILIDGDRGEHYAGVHLPLKSDLGLMSHPSWRRQKTKMDASGQEKHFGAAKHTERKSETRGGVSCMKESRSAGVDMQG